MPVGAAPRLSIGATWDSALSTATSTSLSSSRSARRRRLDLAALSSADSAASSAASASDCLRRQFRHRLAFGRLTVPGLLRLVCPRPAPRIQRPHPRPSPARLRQPTLWPSPLAGPGSSIAACSGVSATSTFGASTSAASASAATASASMSGLSTAVVSTAAVSVVAGSPTGSSSGGGDNSSGLRRIGCGLIHRVRYKSVGS